MKSSDIISIIIIAIIGSVATALMLNVVLGDPNDKKVTFKKIESVSTTLVEPDAELFNSGALNPTVEVYVGEENN